MFPDELRAIVGAEGVRVAEPLRAHTTFAIGGPAEWLVLPGTEEQVRDVVALCRARQVPWRVLGLGSNVLAADAGVRGVVLKLAANFARIEVRDGGRVIAQAGASNADVAEAACAAGLAGYEFASGIPGTVGGAAVMNAGAYDGEFRNVAVHVRCLTPEGDVVDVPADEAAWSYRHSMMMDAGYVVLGAELQLVADDPAAIRARMDDLAQRRAEKQPLEMPSAGSTFKRPEGHFAGKLIQDAGLRGYRVGGAQVSTKHTGFVVNAGGATAADVLQLIADVQQRVYESEGVRLEPEVRLWR
ncbi:MULTISPECIES: UDP-N-acetylmuramate dehydrogenase [unclassified Adlercreutzia]|uniref:UDP-N-acetylmuramate dehydrogenase n=1 Tax=unclassified Adlercreutzia TaxID=2636013 RepID=UPI0013EC7E80|nr:MULTISPECIES: UDP-N-acetylmuramate dehydrogenase [unclassified Adlercreutzia]